ncbi:MAG: PilW family protein [Thermomonas sp.]
MKRIHRHAAGFSLMELMVALVLGLFVTGAAIAIFSANRKTYGATESLGRTQEGVRTAFELMGRDLRAAGSTPCGNSRGTVANVLNDAGSTWYSWNNDLAGSSASMTGMPASGAGSYASGDVIEMHSGNVGGVAINTTSVTPGAFTLTTADHDFRAGDLAMVCDFVRAGIFQIGSAIGTAITYTTGSTPAPGNASLNLAGCDSESPCTGEPLSSLQTGAVLSHLSSTRWYVGNNGNGGTSLYQQTARESTPDTPDEIVPNVTAMQLSYLINTNANFVSDRQVTPDTQYRNAAAVTAADAWNRVLAVRITLTFQDRSDRGDTVVRQLVQTVNLRNHSA